MQHAVLLFCLERPELQHVLAEVQVQLMGSAANGHKGHAETQRHESWWDAVFRKRLAQAVRLGTELYMQEVVASQNTRSNIFYPLTAKIFRSPFSEVIFTPHTTVTR